MDDGRGELSGVAWKLSGIQLGVGHMEKIYHDFLFFIPIHDFITILCHVGFTILQVVWAVQPN